MKPSHLTTPRTLEDCSFAMNADPIEAYVQERMHWKDKLVLWACAFGVVGLVIFA